MIIKISFVIYKIVCRCVCLYVCVCVCMCQNSNYFVTGQVYQLKILLKIIKNFFDENLIFIFMWLILWIIFDY